MQIKRFNKLPKFNSTTNSNLYIAYDKNNQKIILKSEKNNLLRSEKKLQNEYSILNQCKHENIVEVESLSKIDDKIYLIRKYFEGSTLEEFVNKNDLLPFERFFHLAISLSKAIYTLHSNNILHTTISPETILINDNYNVKLAGFGAASFKSEYSDFSYELDVHNIYQSPEQTGRVSDGINFTSDIYSLGMVFYYLLTGKALYEIINESSIPYAVVTKELPSVCLINKNIPKSVSFIIDKMIAKDQKNRYSNIVSVVMDLIRVFDNNCLNEFELDSMRNILELNHLNELFGREEEFKIFDDYLMQLKDNKSSFISIYGDSGIGKSTFTNFMLDKNKNTFSYIVKVKLDEFKQNSSYEILYLALRNLTKQIITKDKTSITLWKKKIEDELKEKVVLLFSIIPELEYIVGAKDSYNISLDSDYKAQFDSVLIRFLQLFSKDDKPLCIYFDDVQWIDFVTLKLIEKLIINLKNVLIITTHRENEVTLTHPFNILLKKLNSIDINVNFLKIEAMTKDSIKKFISNSMEIEEIDEVSRIIFNKTRGNALFVKQYLKELQVENAVYFDFDRLKWFCNLERIENMQISDNVFDILFKQIKLFSNELQYLLKIASCIGNEFSKILLERIYDNKVIFETLLDEAVEKEWLVFSQLKNTIDPLCCFSHDRMKEVVYTSMEDEEKQKIHLKIAQTLYLMENKDNLILCINNFNLALSKLSDIQKNDVFDLNIEACLYSKRNGDFANALNYIKNAMEIIEQPSNYINILKLRAECEHLCHNNKEALYYYNFALEKANTIEEKGLIYELIINFYTDCTKFKEAYEIGRKAVLLFDMELPKEFNKFSLIKNFLVLKYKLKSYKVEQLLEIKEASDEKIKLLIRILSALLKVSYQIKPELSVEISMKLVDLCLKEGITSESVVGFMVFGVIFQGAVLSNHTIGNEYAQLCFKMVDKFNNTTQHAEVQFVCGYFAISWKHPSSYTESLWEDAYNNGIEVGDWFHSACAAAGIIQSMFMRGVNLDFILEKIEYFEVMLKSLGTVEQLGAILSVKQAILNLKNQTNSENSFSDKLFDEELYVNDLKEYKSPHFALFYYLNKMITLYFHKKYKEALDISVEGERFISSAKGMLHHTEYKFYEALIYAKLINNKKTFSNIINLKKIESIQKKFKAWAKSSPENFLAREKILLGEIYRIKNKFDLSIKVFEDALEIVNIYGQKNLEIIINNIISEMYKNKLQRKVTILYANDAKISLEKWIYNKNAQINDCFDKKNNDSFNIQTLTKSAEIIVQERHLSELLKKLIQLIIENASAQSGALLLKNDNEFLIQAQSFVDKEEIYVLQAEKIDDAKSIVKSVINYVINSGETLVLDNLQDNTIFNEDDDVLNRGVKSVLCAPIKLSGELKGIIYLENNLISSVFTYEKVELLKHLSGQIAISIENAQIYYKLEEKVKERTRDLDFKNEELADQNEILLDQNNKISQLNKEVLNENEERKKVELKLQKAIEKLDLLATTDSLTSLKNRRSFDEYLQRAFFQAQRDKKPLSLLICDVDFFKNYNDFYGHQKGDTCLMKVAEILMKSINRASDFVARYGGEEFAIILPDTDKMGALKVANEIHYNLSKCKIIHEKSSVSEYITISIGVSVSNQIDNCDVELLINTADKALYKAKELGRNQTI